MKASKGVFFLLLLLVSLCGSLLSPHQLAAATSYSCNEAGLDAALANGGQVSLSCSSPTTITVSATKTVTKDLTLDGGNLLTISGGNMTRVFSITTGITMGLANLTIENGKAQRGGGIYNSGVLQITASTIRDNSTSGQGGGIYNTGILTVSMSTFSGNSSDNFGGAILNDDSTGAAIGIVTVTTSTFSSNVAWFGGAIANGGTLMVDESTFTRNSATTSFGGGIYTYGSTRDVDIVRSTFIENSAPSGGAIKVWGKLNIENNTFTRNTGDGGALSTYGYVLGSVVTSTNNTMSNNTGGVAVDIESQNDQVTFKNTIVAFNATNNCQGTITSLGYNLDSDTTCGFAATGDLINTDPRLGPLQNNGGATLTMMPQRGSPVVGKIPVSNCPPTDQRGIARPQGPLCDIGSVETFSRWETYLPQAARNRSGW